ncbi:MAG: hypothetical protein WDO19_11065 [Bacteroidota bacterium]
MILHKNAIINNVYNKAFITFNNRYILRKSTWGIVDKNVVSPSKGKTTAIIKQKPRTNPKCRFISKIHRSWIAEKFQKIIDTKKDDKKAAQ